MVDVAMSKREQNTARTRDKLVDAALQLYGSRSIDAVSLREIGVAAGQKNPNALQYHFGDRDGLLQAIVDKHGQAITGLRTAYVQRALRGEWTPAEAAARCMVLPIIDYIEADPNGLNFVKVLSQVAAVYQNGIATGSENGISFPRNKPLTGVFQKALSGLPPREAQRRIYLVVTSTFHSIADIYRAAEQQSPASPVANRKPMVEQLVLLLTGFFSAPSRG